jgi:rod shape determining protein RodA
MYFSDNPTLLKHKVMPLGPVAQIMQRLIIDGQLLGGLLLICGLGLMILYSAVGEDINILLQQCVRLSISIIGLFVVAQLTPDVLRRWTPWCYFIGLILLILVLVLGEIGQGARRWLSLGIRFQPSEIMKLAVPMMAAWYLHDKKLPPKGSQMLIIAALIFVPTALTAIQPDLGTALLVATAGLLVLVLAGMSIRLMTVLCLMTVPGALLFWHYVMQGYQKQRILTLFNPDSDPLGAGYNIIQSKIAIGSGGLFGKGWTNGSQSQLEFLPEPQTDFIFSVIGEELGLMGTLSLLGLYLFVVGRGLYIATQSHDTYSRLLAGSISLTFFVYVFINTAMVTGILPVVGIPLPLVSFGGTSMVTIMMGFGIIMSIQTHRKLLPH